MLTLPQILDIPPKLIPVITQFNNYRFFLLEGGRGGGKSQSIARILLWLAENRKIRVVCGREQQNTIDESVKTILSDLINTYQLNFTIKDKEITHNVTGSVFKFKGFREQGRVNIKGLEGTDILWVDEAEAITKPTLDVLIPTIRKNKSKVFFTMNRYVRKDPVFEQCATDKDCLHIKINYYDNPHCPEVLINEAKKCREKSEKDYQHIWEGNPLDQSNDYLLAATKIDEATKLNLNDETIIKHKVLSIDLAGSGGDLNVAKLIVQKNTTGWIDEITNKWSDADTDVTKGKIINLYSIYKPDILVIDGDGVGYSIAVSLKNTLENVVIFRGAGKVKNIQSSAKNARAEGYLILKEFIQNGWLQLKDSETIRQLEYIKLVYKPSGHILIQSKDEMRKENGESPDYADSLMMALYAIDKHSHLLVKNNFKNNTSGPKVISDFDPFD